LSEKKLGWGLIGCGDIARKRVAAAIRDLRAGDFVGVCRGQAGRASEFAREFGARRWYVDWREMLSDPEIAAVYVATPVHLHAPITIAAADAGRHILCEKPMALSLQECSQMIAAARANDVFLGIAYYRRYYPILSRIEEILASGTIGAPVLARFDAFESYDPAPDDPRHWFLQKEYSGGGPMFDFGCHRIEVLLRLFGDPDSVEGRTWTLQLRREVEDTALALLRYPQGLVAQITVSHALSESRDTLEILGTKGSIKVPILNKSRLEIITRDGTIIEDHPPHPNLHFPLIEDFTNSVLQRREPLVNGEVGRAVNRILERVYK